jgi:hypothetical protein
MVRDANSEEKKSAKAGSKQQSADQEGGETNFSAAKTLDAEINAQEGKLANF